jgi:hypothetical protein
LPVGQVEELGIVGPEYLSGFTLFSGADFSDFRTRQSAAAITLVSASRAEIPSLCACSRETCHRAAEVKIHVVWMREYHESALTDNVFDSPLQKI